MILTAEDMYKEFLNMIKKESTSVISPTYFNSIINVSGQDQWIKEKVVETELDQKRIDDLQKLRVVTDGIGTYYVSVTETITLYPIIPDTSQNYVFSLPINPTTLINNNQSTTQHYSRYLRMLNVMFKINYVSNECELTGISDWMKANIMRSDKRAISYKNKYRKPKDSRLYYEVINDKIRLITETSSTGNSMRLEYLRYPRDIFFDPNRVTPNDVNCELPPQQQSEIVSLAAQTYLERAKDERYQSFLNEQMLMRFSK